MTPAQRPTPQRPPVAHGLWLTRGSFADSCSWAEHAVVPTVVVPQSGRSLVSPRGGPKASPPYVDAALLSAARVVPRGLAPAIGFWVIQDRAVLTVRNPGWREQTRWVVWDPELGVMRTPGLPRASTQQVVAAAGHGSRRELREMFAETQHQPVRLLSAVMSILSVPGAGVLSDPFSAEDLPGAKIFHPTSKEVGNFDDAVKGAVMLRQELETPG